MLATNVTNYSTTIIVDNERFFNILHNILRAASLKLVVLFLSINRGDRNMNQFIQLDINILNNNDLNSDEKK